MYTYIDNAGLRVQRRCWVSKAQAGHCRCSLVALITSWHRIPFHLNSLASLQSSSAILSCIHPSLVSFSGTVCSLNLLFAFHELRCSHVSEFLVRFPSCSCELLLMGAGFMGIELHDGLTGYLERGVYRSVVFEV